eukprot:6181737-Pleurochrysis_carterae.AAC.2
MPIVSSANPVLMALHVPMAIPSMRTSVDAEGIESEEEHWQNRWLGMLWCRTALAISFTSQVDCRHHDYCRSTCQVVRDISMCSCRVVRAQKRIFKVVEKALNAVQSIPL